MTRDDIIAMAREAKLPYYYRTGEVSNLDQLERFAALVATAEREACAKLCEEVLEQYRGTDMGKHAELVGDDCADAIRARGQE